MRPYRKMWVSDKAKAFWAPTFIAFAQSWRQIEWITVLADVRPCGTLVMTRAELADLSKVIRPHGLKLEIISCRRVYRNGVAKLCYRVLVAQPRNATHFCKAARARDSIELGKLLGYPRCCCDAYCENSLRRENNDAFWNMACNSPKSPIGTNEIVIEGDWQLNPFYRDEGVRLINHLPCSFKCGNSKTLSNEIIAIGKEAGYEEVLAEGAEILTWPVEWSSLNGISEVRTPLLKAVSCTADTYPKKTITWIGTKYPLEGSTALRNRLKVADHH